MDEHQIRALVRQAIARHHGVTVGRPVPSAPRRTAMSAMQAQPSRPSAAQFHLERPAAETDCLIEPTVTCNHCGHCQCFGY